MPVYIRPFPPSTPAMNGAPRAQKAQQKPAVEEPNNDLSPQPRGRTRLFGFFATKPEPTRPAVYDQKHEKELLKGLYKCFRSYHAQTASSDVRSALRELHAGGHDVRALAKRANRVIYAAQNVRADKRQKELAAGIGDYENEYLDGASSLLPPLDHEVIHVLKHLARDESDAAIKSLRDALEQGAIPAPPPPAAPRREPSPPPKAKPNPEPATSASAKRSQAPGADAPLLGTEVTGRQLVAALEPGLSTAQQRARLESIPEEAWELIAKVFTFNDDGVVRDPGQCRQVLSACQVEPTDTAARDRLVKGINSAFFAIHADKNSGAQSDRLKVALGAVQAIRRALRDEVSLAALS